MEISRKVLNHLRSGDFTLYYHDNGACSLYPGLIKDICDKESEELPEPIAEFGGTEYGYVPGEVLALVKALGGIAESV